MFRIATEAKNVEQIEAFLCGFGLDYTLVPGKGAYHGVEESSVIIELENSLRGHVEYAAETIKIMNRQEAVMVQEIPSISKLI